MGDDDCTQRKSDLAKEFKHTKTDIWEVYEQIPTGKIGAIIPGISKLFRNLELIEDLPFVWRMVRDVIKIKSCWYYLCLFILVKLLSSLEPAVELWCVIIRVIFRPLIVLIFTTQVHQSLPHHRSYSSEPPLHPLIGVTDPSGRGRTALRREAAHLHFHWSALLRHRQGGSRILGTKPPSPTRPANERAL